jgi:large subunit ribosomal protein L35
MPKLKSHSGAKKRFRLTASGKVRMNHAGKNHFMRRRSQKFIRTTRGTRIMSEPDQKIIKRNFLRNA